MEHKLQLPVSIIMYVTIYTIETNSVTIITKVGPLMLTPINAFFHSIMYTVLCCKITQYKPHTKSQVQFMPIESPKQPLLHFVMCDHIPSLGFLCG